MGLISNTPPKGENEKFVSNIDNLSDDEAKVIEIIKNDGMLAAVKWYKDSHGCELAEAKSFVDSITEKHNLSLRTSGGQGCMIAMLVVITFAISAILCS